MTWTTPKTDWNNGELVTASEMNEIGENLTALRHPSTAVAVYTATEDFVGHSGSFADIDSDNMNLTITTSGGDVLVHFYSAMSRGGRNSTGAYFDIDVDGNRQGNSEGITRVGLDSWARNVSFTYLIQNLSPGPHTFKLQWRTNHSVRLQTGMQFWVREI